MAQDTEGRMTCMSSTTCARTQHISLSGPRCHREGSVVRTYRPDERHEFDPGPCPKCGGTECQVNWVDLGNGTFVGEEAIPGTVACLNPDCEWGPGRIDDSQPCETWVRKLPSD